MMSFCLYDHFFRPRRLQSPSVSLNQLDTNAVRQHFVWFMCGQHIVCAFHKLFKKKTAIENTYNTQSMLEMDDQQVFIEVKYYNRAVAISVCLLFALRMDL